MTVAVRRPGGPLGGLVTAIAYMSGEQPARSVERLMPATGTSLWVNLNRDAFRSYDEAGRPREAPGAMLAGPASRAVICEFEAGHAHVCVHFALGRAGPFLGAPPARDQFVPLRERLLAAATPEDAIAVAEQIMAERLRWHGGDGAHQPDRAALAAARSLAGGARVGQVAGDLGLLERTLRRRFTAAVGLSPKRFGRVERIRRLVRGLDGRAEADWAGLAAAHGYTDQPHLAGEFRELAGVTPGEYLRSRMAAGPNHVRVPAGFGD